MYDREHFDQKKFDQKNIWSEEILIYNTIKYDLNSGLQNWLQLNNGRNFSWYLWS